MLYMNIVVLLKCYLCSSIVQALYIKHIYCVVLSNVSLGACLLLCWSVYVCDGVCAYVCGLCIIKE